MALSGDRARLYEEEAKRKSGITAGEAVSSPLYSIREAVCASYMCLRLDTSGKVLELIAFSEKGDLTELRPHLADDAVTWACFSFSPGAPHAESSRKIAFFGCVGSSVGAIKRGKVALQKSGVMLSLGDIAADVGIFQGSAEVTDEAILTELRRNFPAASLL